MNLIPTHREDIGVFNNIAYVRHRGQFRGAQPTQADTPCLTRAQCPKTRSKESGC